MAANFAKLPELLRAGASTSVGDRQTTADRLWPVLPGVAGIRPRRRKIASPRDLRLARDLLQLP